MKPTVGRIVHFYSTNWGAQSCSPACTGPGYNGVGEGPYAAIITQVFEGTGEYAERPYCNLMVFAPFSGSGPMDCGSVREKGPEHDETGGCWWTWPPRDS
jgi:hypothetical protein